MPVTNYFWDPLQDNVTKEYDENGDTIARYTTEPDLYGNLISQERNGVTSYFHFDGQGSTLALTNNDGVVTDTYAYNAFGEGMEKNGTTDNPRRYAGEQGYHCDTEINGYQVRARTYAPKLIRWISVDPIRGRTLIAGYRYCTNLPTIYTDPSGKKTKVPDFYYHWCGARLLWRWEKCSTMGGGTLGPDDFFENPIVEKMPEPPKEGLPEGPPLFTEFSGFREYWKVEASGHCSLPGFLVAHYEAKPNDESATKSRFYIIATTSKPVQCRVEYDGWRKFDIECDVQCVPVHIQPCLVPICSCYEFTGEFVLIRGYPSCATSFEVEVLTGLYKASRGAGRDPHEIPVAAGHKWKIRYSSPECQGCFDVRDCNIHIEYTGKVDQRAMPRYGKPYQAPLA